MAAERQNASVTVQRIAGAIHFLRGQKVLLDADLAALYGVTTARFNQQVKRNLKRFPRDFTFRLTQQERSALMLQSATSNLRRGGRRKLPHVFTEHGAIMAATILRTPRAVEVSVYVVRAFVQLRRYLGSNKELASRLDELEARVSRRLTAHDRTIAEIVGIIRKLMSVPVPRRRPIGFTANLDEEV